jgi:4-diphosphocytidyl-2-C-methyl-D-erythritol kinase
VILDAFAKVNLSLLVRERDASGYHPLRSLIQSIGWSDSLTLAPADDDLLTVTGTEPVSSDDDNLAWRAASAMRERLGSRRPLTVHLDKRIPVGAGLGGGSADAAAALVGTARLLGGDPSAAADLAPSLGSDVPFCVVGGTARVEGRGELVTPLRLHPDYALAVAVPPTAVATPEIYRRWDRLDGPQGPEIDGRRVPPSLRDLGPIRNDLVPAAVDRHPEVGDFMADLAARWERPVLLTGSGSAVFGFFLDADEAVAAIRSLPDVRGSWAGLPETAGWRVVAEGS